MSSSAHYEEILAKQIAMNRSTWDSLQKHGITEESQVELEFSYNAPSQKSADGMCALIKEQTDYDARTVSSGLFFNRKWRVEGHTQQTAVSAAILDQWVTWMVAAGRERGCDFDGWGTSV